MVLDRPFWKAPLTGLLAVCLAGCPAPERPPVTQPGGAAETSAPPTPPAVIAEPLPPDSASPPAPPPAPGAENSRVPQPEDAPAETSLVPQPEVVQPPRTPARPLDSWIIFRKAFDQTKDATCHLEWTGGNRLVVTTENIERLTLDLTQLPAGAPEKGPWNLQLDGQGIEITGFTPKPGYTGKIRDLVRTPNGVWTVDKKKLYRYSAGR